MIGLFTGFKKILFCHITLILKFCSHHQIQSPIINPLQIILPKVSPWIQLLTLQCIKRDKEYLPKKECF